MSESWCPRPVVRVLDRPEVGLREARLVLLAVQHALLLLIRTVQDDEEAGLVAEAAADVAEATAELDWVRPPVLTSGLDLVVMLPVNRLDIDPRAVVMEARSGRVARSGRTVAGRLGAAGRGGRAGWTEAEELIAATRFPQPRTRRVHGDAVAIRGLLHEVSGGPGKAEVVAGRLLPLVVAQREVARG